MPCPITVASAGMRQLQHGRWHALSAGSAHRSQSQFALSSAPPRRALCGLKPFQARISHQCYHGI